MTDSQIPWWTVKLSGDESLAIAKVLDSSFINEGPVCLGLEKTFREYFDVRHAVLTTSGTAALFLALKALGIKEGTKVAVPNLTFIATASAVRLCGGTPVLIDIDLNQLTIDPDHLFQQFKLHKFEYVIPVHISGRSSFSREFWDVVAQCKLKVVEDAAESLGSIDPNSKRHLGSVGVAGAYSFSPNKVLTSGQGGLVVTNDDDLARKIRALKDQGRTQRGTGGDDLHPYVGFNFKFTDIQASMIVSQLSSLDSRLEHLRNVYRYYRANILAHENHKLLEFNLSSGEVPLWPEFSSSNRKKLEEVLYKNGIGYRNIWLPLSSQQPYLEDETLFANSKLASTRTLWLPSSFSLKDEELLRITETINAFIRRTEAQ